jgi:hypothetical protein
MKSIRFHLLLFFLVIAGAAQAQENTKVRFYVKGSAEYFIKLNGELLPSRNTQMIAPGEHEIEIWSPMHLTYNGKLVVPEKDSISYYQELEKDPKYIAYLFENDKYKRKLLFGRTMPVMAAGLGVIGSPIFYTLRKRDHETLVIERFKSSYFADQNGADIAQSRYNVTNALFFTSVGLAVGGAITYYFLNRKLRETTKPKYKQLNPFTLEQFEISYHPLLQTPQAGFTLSF